MRKQKIKSEEDKIKKVNFLISLGYTEEEALNNRLKVSSQNSYLYWMYNGLSKEDSIRKVSEIQKSKSPRCKEYWIKRGYNENDAILEVSKYQDNVSLEYTIKNGGSLDDYNSKCINRRINKEKYISLYGEEDGLNRWIDKKNKSKITLENMIRVYGENDGEERWKSYIDSQKYSQSIEGLIKRHGEKKAYEIYDFRKKLSQFCINKFLQTGEHKFLNNSFSKSSQILFWKIYDKLPDELREKCYFKELNHEYVLVTDNNKNCYLYDFVISNINFCIEFNGDFWHANPNFYKSDDNIFEKKALEIWERDKIKIVTLKKMRNIETIIIWESEWKKDKISIENSIIEKIFNIYDKNIRESC